ncbi:NADPH:quinone reductase-like Zn-dependent oxidoreductase [Pseudoclavibacter chungangensis]|uniref:NADP-dependent oxidoreductase n=1 Tax=Pseudoclavibacter chungangensis TaxID=587635 RepID=UPI00178E3966|nr:NADP-dependent oxidoreductase [Pseudoclavibacter chungangensis]NYJ67831.1 NADPH:quinone reductase-like Zn-dependent oxidoreductase [Pseudoclavibacter chungangensis]
MTDPSTLPPLPETMRAAVVTSAGGPEVIELQDLALPAQINSDTLVRVHAAGVNPIDWKTREGRGAALPAYPWVLGGEFSGTVVRASYELAPFQPGDEVFGMLLVPRYLGADAEYVSCPFMSLARKPASLTHLEAGAVPLAALTAWAGIVEAGRVHTGQRVLVHAGAGGVGHFAVQLAHHYGAHVVATASARNHDWVRELGADQVIDYTADRFEEAIDAPVDLVLDLIGDVQAETGTRSLDPRVLRDGGTYICVPTGAFPGMHAAIAAQDRDLVGSTLKLSPDGRALETIAILIDQGDLRVHVDRVFPLAATAEAQVLVADGHVRGKVVLDLDA